MSNRLCELTLGLMASSLAVACSDEQVPATQVIVTVNSDLDVGTELTSVEVFVLDADGDNVVSMRAFELTDGARMSGKVRLPFSLGIEKRKESRFRLDVIGYGPSGAGGESRAVVEHKVHATFRDRETLLLKVFLGAACFEQVCTGERTCYPDAAGDVAAGACGDVRQPDLETARPGAEDSAWDEPRDDAGAGAGALPGGRGEAGRAGEPATAGRAGSTGEGGMGGALADAGTGGTAGAAGMGAAGSDGNAGAGGAGAGGSGAGGSAGAQACESTGEVAKPIDDVSVHVATTLPSDYASQPPSSGPHCEESGVYTTYPPESPLLPCHFVRNIEKGAIVLLYNCPTPCPELVAGLEQVIADAIDDPDCTPVDDLQRLLLTPYAGMDATFAATAWGVTWTSTCSTLTANDRAGLLAFIEDHWGTRGDGPVSNDCSYGSVYPGE